MKKKKGRRIEDGELLNFLFSCWFEGSIVTLFTLLFYFYSYLISGLENGGGRKGARLLVGTLKEMTISMLNYVFSKYVVELTR